jgi:putative endonuclease
MWFIYILLCEDGSFYTGSSNDVQKRFLTHKEGKGGKYTRSHQPVKVIYSEEFATKIEALKREFQIKSWSRGKKIKNLHLASASGDS